jgi:hypothetical protein
MVLAYWRLFAVAWTITVHISRSYLDKFLECIDISYIFKHVFKWEFWSKTSLEYVTSKRPPAVVATPPVYPVS